MKVLRNRYPLAATNRNGISSSRPPQTCPAALVRGSLLGLALAVSACATTSQAPVPDAASGAPAADQFYTDRDPFANMAYWGGRLDQNPDDLEAALHYGRNLRYLGRTEEAVKTLADGLSRHPDHAELLAEYGKALANIGRIDEGIEYLNKAAAHRPKDWSIVSAKGVAYDQKGNHDQAIRFYQEALALSPDNPSVLNNLALSEAQIGNLANAEQLLRRAVSQPESTPRMRLNLALILGLQGHFEEARKYAALDLPPVKVEENLALIKSMQADPSPWDALRTLDP